MHIIPVIDLKRGIVVHAKHGKRDGYAPLQSGLCKTSDIFEVVNAFWALFRCSTVYVADLDAITRQGSNPQLLGAVLTTFPHITFWIDGGYPLSSADLLERDNFVPVLGSESFLEENISELSQFSDNFILSLDYAATGELGALSLFSRQDLWPEHIIIMNLPRVGSNLGPDLEKLIAYRKQFPRHNFIAAGGIRDDEDLKALHQIGIRQALIATALHNGKISPISLNYQAKKYPD
jgi:phosphoribosylformimino-5-aminoimidazole carboxamide ribotide isomerase